MKLRSLLVAVVMVVLLPLGIHAQRVDFQSVYDSVARLSDGPLLRRMERTLPLPGAATTLEPIVRRGLIALRLYALEQDRPDGERARETFARAVERFPREPWSHYGQALAWARGPDARLPLVGGVLPQVTVAQTVAEIFGRDASSRAWRAAERALEVEPAFGPAAVLLAELAVADGRSRDELREARTALVAARAAGDHTPAVARALADMETALGNYAAAAEAAHAGGGNAGALRSRGIALMLQPGKQGEGYAQYRQAIDGADLDAAGLLYQDVAVLVNAQEAAEWKAAGTAEQKRAWLARFWDRRAAEAGVTPAERVAEHYRRLGVARERYVRNARRGSENETGAPLLAERSAEEHIFDDRGVIMIRHGAPLEAVRTGANGVLPNETWAYRLPGREDLLLFHFVALRGAQDFSLVPDILRAVDPSVLEVEKVLRGMSPQTAAAARSGGYTFDANTLRDLRRRELAVMSLVEDRAGLDPRYRQGISRLRQLLQSGHPLDGTEVRSVMERTEAENRVGARVALRTDSYARAYTGALAFHHDVFTFRTPFARTDVTAAFALPAGELKAAPDGRYALRLSLILTDTLQDLITRVDTTAVVTRSAADGYVRTHLTMPVVPSEHTLFRVVAEDAIGGRGGVQRGGVRLRDYSSNRLQVSDVVLALPDSAGEWRRGDVELALVLPRRFGQDRPFTVFYEVYNLAADAPYVTEITVEPVEGGGVLKRLFGGGPDRLKLRFEGVAAPGSDGVVQELRRLASDLKAGSYRLEIEVTNRATGESAGTSTVFTVSE